MTPVSPTVPFRLRLEGMYEVLPEVIFAKDQPPYIPLPALRTQEGVVISRWHMSWRERLQALLYGDVYLQLNTFNKPPQASRVSTDYPRGYGVK